MSRRDYYSIFWFGFIREAFNFWCVQQLGCILVFYSSHCCNGRFLVPILAFYAIRICFRYWNHRLMKSIHNKIWYRFCIVHCVQVFRYWNWNQSFIKFGHLPKNFRYWSQNNWNQFFIKFEHFAQDLMLHDEKIISFCWRCLLETVNSQSMNFDWNLRSLPNLR